MSHQSLEQKLRTAGSAVQMARRSPVEPYVSRVQAEFSNWRDEQRAWRETAALLDLTHHMTDLTLEGPDALRLLSDLGVNSFANFKVNQAKQFVCCSPDGYVIGDGILFFLHENEISLLGLPPAHNWVQYHAQSGHYRVNVRRDEPTSINPAGRRRLYRFQVQGPNALKVLAEASGGSLPDIKFFRIGEFTIAGRRVRALRHGMAGTPGLEIFGPWDDADDVRAAVIEAGARFGLRRVGSRAYITTTLESGWIPAMPPAIFTGEELRPYREWLTADSFEATASLGGSYYSDDIADYYVTPHELGYWPFVKFDHDFIGRAALEEMQDRPRRRKVTLAWNAEDVGAAMHTLLRKGHAAKYIDLPYSGYSTWQCDRIMRGRSMVGISTHPGYSYNERSMLSLAMLDMDVPIGAEVTMVWGEEGREWVQPPVERHVQAEIRAIVCPCPYSEVTRTSYASGSWRAKAVTA